jgi:DNA-binding NarL/FixJ family response regulator
LERIADARADLAIVDLALPDQGGLELIKDLRIQFPDLPILVHSMHDGTIFAERAIRAGARGYVMKQESGRELISALRQVLAGKIYLGKFSVPRPSPKTHSKPALDTGGPISLLSDREFEIMQHIGSGRSNREIALRLRLSIKTVDAHRERIKRKLGLKSTTALNLFAVRWVNSLTTA